MNYVYDLAGDVTSWLHPAGFTVNNSSTDSPINGAQQVRKITSTLSDTTHPGTLAQNISYTPFGAMSSLQNGCVGTGCVNRHETYNYNNRLQVTMIKFNPTSNYEQPEPLAQPRPAGGERLQSPVPQPLCLCDERPDNADRPAGPRPGVCARNILRGGRYGENLPNGVGVL